MESKLFADVYTLLMERREKNETLSGGKRIEFCKKENREKITPWTDAKHIEQLVTIGNKNKSKVLSI